MMPSLPAATPSKTSDANENTATLWSAIPTSYAYIAIWIGLSTIVIIYNKFLLGGFPYPVVCLFPVVCFFTMLVPHRSCLTLAPRLPLPARALTMWHMFFCSALATFLVMSGKMQAVDNMSSEIYLKAIVPISACYAATLWAGNVAYMYLSISFIQMLKALTPAAVFAVGCIFGTDQFDTATMFNLLLITAGITITSFGELNFDVIGVACQLTSIFAESLRLVLVQILLQSCGLELNPVTTLYYVAPCCFMFLLIPFMALEMDRITTDTNLVINPIYMLTNAAAAFALNMAVFLLIGKTSALTMKIAGIAKDWILIGLSVAVFHSRVTQLNLLGYLIAFGGICGYNYQKLHAAKYTVLPTTRVDFDLPPSQTGLGAMRRLL
jgi:hypothetical protein